MTKKSYFSKKIKMNKVSEILSYITECIAKMFIRICLTILIL